jgi:hypothetical protein
MEYTGVLSSGKEDHTSEEARNIKGGKEIYRISDIKGVTNLLIESDTFEDLFQEMATSWGKALKRIKDLSEK